MKLNKLPDLMFLAGGMCILLSGLAVLCWLAIACHITGEWWGMALEIVLLIGAWHAAAWIINAVRFAVDFMRAE